MRIIEVTQGEKHKAIDDILLKGLQRPRSAWSLFGEIRQLLGFRFLFWDTAQAFVLSAITLTGVLLFLLFSPESSKHAILFACSPLLFMIVLVFSETAERTGALYELKLTCKYSIRQIAACRIMCFSLPGIVFCLGVSAYQSGAAHPLLQLLPLSLCALFLCAVISLIFIRRFAGKWVFVSAVLFWIVITVIPALIFGNRWELFLSGLPAFVTVGVAILSAVLFLLEIRKLLNAVPKEAMGYAAG
jgi:hypothetical protein